ncbi:T9SS type A sorting domain-containing protein [Aureispira anguillae]|nr:T9SS type A sorting domain-containing protein [Aureispira anguillae]
MGLDLTYKCIGNNQYEINLTFYRDCNGISAPSSPRVSWAAACGSGTLTLQKVSMQEITPSCQGIVGTACNGGNGIYGIEEHKYQTILTLPTGCTNITLSHSTCCRNNAITTLNSPGNERIYVEAQISDATLCNNSPVFTNNPVPFGCIGQPVFYNHGASDADGDNLVYSLVSCLDGANTPVNYGAGFSAATPLATTNGVTIDPATGAISFTPSMAQVGVICVAVQEYRNGVMIGEIVRDIQFTAIPCSNNVPTLSGIDNTTDYSTTATVGTQLCFNMNSNDVDANQSTSLTWNNAIAGATFSSAGAPHAVGTFCWTPTAADVGTHSFTVTVLDDYCPIVGQNTYTFTIDVQPVVCDSIDVTVVSTTDLTCSNNDGVAVLSASNGVAPYTYQLVNWTTGDFFSNTTGTFTTLTAGTYNVWVADANGCTPACSGHTFVIGGNVTPLTITSTTTDVSCSSNSLNTVDSTNSDGSLTITATGGTPPYLYSIDGSNFQSSNTFTNLAAGVYTSIVIDANGCSQMVVDTVGEPDPISIGVASVTAATCGQANGSITLTATGGTPGFLYYINGQSQSSPTFTGLAAGTYTFSVCDINYCVYDTTIVIPGTPALVAAGSATNVSCHGSCDGTATATVVSGGSGTASIVWDNGMTGATIGNLCAGTYTAIVTNADGCADTVTVVVTEPTAIAASSTSTDVSCSSNSTNTVDPTNSDGSITVTATGGTTPYTYSIDGVNFQSTGSFTNLGSGVYSVTVTDANGCTQTVVDTVNEPDLISIGVASITAATCGLADGSITLTATGGTPGFLYYINGQSQSSPTFTGLAAGTYTFSVCDINYCVYDTTIVIPGTVGFVASATSTSPLCSGDCNGTASVTTSDNSNTYTIAWDNGMTGATIGNLCAGTYTAIVTNADGCADTVSVTVTEPAPISVNLASSTDETCNGNDGTATLAVTGGTAPYVIDLANFSTATTYSNGTGVFTGLNAGQHIVNVTDANGCGVNCATNFVLNGCGMNPLAPTSPLALAPMLSVYPNPASSLVQVRYQTSEKAVSLSILDNNGKPVYNRGNLNAEGSLEVMVNGWSSSTYFVVLKGANGELIKTQKLIITD